MSNRVKNSIWAAVLIVLSIVGYKYQQWTNAKYVAFQGRTMGTTYLIRYEDDERRSLKPQVDSLLVAFNASLSTYEPDSEISRLNRDNQIRFQSAYFFPVLEKSTEVFRRTNGAFDPTVGPLVNAWGFGPERRQRLDTAQVDSLRALVGFDRLRYDAQQITKPHDGMRLDFSAIAKGYGVDVVGEFLEGSGIQDYMVEIGGEVRCRGESPADVPWTIGIRNPKYRDQPGGPAGVLKISLANRALATSGNYENYYEVDGRRYAHTIDPKTGFPVQHTLLSASVLADDCMTADAYATAFMVLGTDSAIALARQLPELEVLLVYDDAEGNLMTYQTPGMEQVIAGE
ncbi:MAG: FAD:protein FMN transferase [Catalinimonas sp.]